MAIRVLEQNMKFCSCIQTVIHLFTGKYEIYSCTHTASRFNGQSLFTTKYEI